jgi:hypothetical protein
MTEFEITNNVKILHEPARAWLEGRARNDSSQFGEDGLIEAALDRLGCDNRFCFEVGAADGFYFSNTLRLREHGWNCLLIEKDAEQFAKLKALESPNVCCVQADVTAIPLDDLLWRYRWPHNCDLGVIDIDGQDYHVWDAMKEYAPRLMLVEYSLALENPPPPLSCIDVTRQAGRGAILEMGTKKGYIALAQTHVNILFAERGLVA